MASAGFLFINKTAHSNSLTQSDGTERESLYKHVQRTASAKINASDRNSFDLRLKRKYIRRQQRGTADQQTHHTDPVRDTAVPHLLITPTNGSAYRSQLLGMFVEENVCSLRHQSDFKDIQSFFWLMILPRLNESNEGLRCSITALACAAVGQERKDCRLIKASAVEYGKALKAIQRDLSLADSTLAACLTLILYQFFSHHIGQQDWHTHIQGMAKIIQLRGPEEFQHGLAHTLFVCARSSIISASLNRRKSTFLSEQMWSTTPWEHRQKSAYEQMLDCLAILSSSAEFYEHVRDLPRVIRDQQRLVLLDHLWSSNSRLLQWFTTISGRARPLAVVPTTIPVLQDDPSCQHPLPLSYEFESLAKANMFRIFCASLVDIYNMLALTYQALEVADIADVSLVPYEKRCVLCSPESRPLHERTNSTQSSAACDIVTHAGLYFCSTGGFHCEFLLSANEVAIKEASSLAQACSTFATCLAGEICKSFQYCIKEEHRTAGRYLSVAPLKFAIWCFRLNLPRTDTQLSWSLNAVKLLSSAGIRFSENLLTDQPYGRK